MTKIRYERGVFVINDSIAVSGNTYLWKNFSNEKSEINKNFTIADVPTPYKIIKKANNAIIRIAKSDTHCFRYVSLN